MKKALLFIPIVICMICLIGCENMRGRDVGTVAGGAVGALAGSTIGGGSGKAVATVGGAVVGGVIGHEIGKSQENK